MHKEFWHPLILSRKIGMDMDVHMENVTKNTKFANVLHLYFLISVQRSGSPGIELFLCFLTKFPVGVLLAWENLN